MTNVLNEQFPGRWIGMRSETIVWPARSPDLTPLDYWLWPYLKHKLYESGVLYADVERLVDEIHFICQNIPAMYIQNATRAFTDRIQKCIDVNGGHFEHKYR